LPPASFASLTLAVLYLLIIAFALAFGAKAERLGGVIFLVSTAATWTIQALGDWAPLPLLMGVDVATVACFTWLTFRYPDKLWPGLTACAQLLMVTFSATRVLDFPLSMTGYLIALNLSALLGFVFLAYGTWASRWGKRLVDEWGDSAHNAAV
jgi:hypothetical protein